MRIFVSRLLVFVSMISGLTIANPADDAQIKRVEQGLLPAVLIKGEPGFSITERMKFYKVPALSVAVTLLQEGKLAEATALLKLNVEFYPNAWNTYDSLGEAYMQAGQKDLAIANYKKSLELNPENSNGREMLKKLEQ